ncbi:hypothetical protein SD457_12795 [Coprobacillaceae bacterium CR2/5/TPMF4]|nr:hypothetical protein SD457_12795 [Coprobacillaceae bacterium CR2/5/TPMF4]
MKYLLVEKTKLPKVRETEDIQKVINDMYGNDYMILNEDSNLLGISKCKFPALIELIEDAQRWDCLWIGVSNCVGETEDMVEASV